MPRLSTSDARKGIIPLPPINIQRAIYYTDDGSLHIQWWYGDKYFLNDIFSNSLLANDSIKSAGTSLYEVVRFEK